MLTLVMPPAVLPVTLEEAKNHVRVDYAEDDGAIEAYLRAATERYDGRDGLLGRCLITQTWSLSLDRFPAEILIPLTPCQSIDEITYTDETGAPQSFTAFHVLGLGTIEGAHLSPVSQWPTGSGVSVTFTAGYGNSPEDVPAPIRQAILTRACQFYDTRDTIADLPNGVDGSLRDHRAWVF